MKLRVVNIKNWVRVSAYKDSVDAFVEMQRVFDQLSAESDKIIRHNEMLYVSNDTLLNSLVFYRCIGIPFSMVMGGLLHWWLG